MGRSFLPWLAGESGCSVACTLACHSHADVDQLAHYILLRFGEDANANRAAAGEEPGTPPHPGAAGAAAAQEQPHDLGDFSIAALRSKAAAAAGDAAAAGRGAGGAGRALRAGCAGNGQALAGRIRGEVEQGGLHSTLSALLELHHGLRATQERVLQLQQQLAAQQAGVLSALQPAEQQQADVQGPQRRAGPGRELPPG